jgi:glyoxylase-like metal-dependent hydrolase (beta-lactamase superfamily II)
LSAEQREVTLSAYALVKASYTDRMPFYAKIGWLEDTSKILDQALKANQQAGFIAHWSAGIIYTQIPPILGYQDQALEHLLWCVEHSQQEPAAGFLRETYFYLAKLYDDRDQEKLSLKFLRLSGHQDFNKSNLQIGPLTTDQLDGSSFYPRKTIAEIVADQVYVARGFGFSEIYFIISENRRELIGIDAGTHPDSLQAAYSLFKQLQPDSPPLTAVFVTHTHWDHIGGHEFYRLLNPAVTFYARDSYHDTVARITDHEPRYKYFRGSKFNNAWINSFKPDVLIDATTQITVDGTVIKMIPVPGGETSDGLFFHLPQLDIIFTGDFIMPYFGDVWVEEGNVPGTLPAIKAIIDSKAKTVLHGHYGLTNNFDATTMPGLYYSLDWLNDEIIEQLSRRTPRAEIHRLNLTPPDISQYPEAMLPFLILREGAINRLYDQYVGVWGPDLQGVDTVGTVEYANLFSVYLDLSAAELATGLERMVENGDYELALKVMQWAKPAYENNVELARLNRTILERLKEKYQFLSPFKFFLYSELQETGLSVLQDAEFKPE